MTINERFFMEFSNGTVEMTISDDGIDFKRSAPSTTAIATNVKRTYDCFIPCGAFKEISFLLGSYFINFYSGFDEYQIDGVILKEERKRFKKAINDFKAINASVPQNKNAIIRDTDTTSAITYVAGENIEYRMLCNVCGHLYCFSNKDIEENQKNIELEKSHRNSAIVGAFGGSVYASRMDGNKADEYKSKIIDFNKCPNCNSSDVKQITDEEWEDNKKNKADVSPIEEVKKLKELVDMGILTQEEFDTKKKQLLGL